MLLVFGEHLAGARSGAWDGEMDVSASLSARRSRIVVDASACELDDLAPCGAVDVTVGGGLDWGELAQRAVASGWPGIERLGGVPGTVADVIRINAEVDGQAVADVVASVGTWDRAAGRTRTFSFVECEFGASTSRFEERLPDGQYRYDIVDASFLFKQGDLTAPIGDPELAALLGIGPGDRLPLTEYAARRARRGPVPASAQPSPS
jgi:UDP-N-acetylmuramate dehydrogenase